MRATRALLGRGGIFSPYHESWRKHPMLMNTNHWTLVLPGIREAVAIFSVYCAAEWMYNKLTAKKGGHG